MPLNPDEGPPSSQSTQSVRSPDQASLHTVSKQPLSSEATIGINDKLHPILERLDRFFDTQQEGAGASHIDRAKATLAFIRGISPSILQEANANREREPLAKALYERCDTELRHAIPMLSPMEKISLLRSGYPVGSGKDSLAELCVNSGLDKKGFGDTMLLFSESREKKDPHTPWSADVLRGATAALENARCGVTAKYLKGLRRMFSPSSAWASKAHEVFNETTVKLPFTTLTEIYAKIRESNSYAVELKYAVLSTLIDSINRATKEFFRDDLIVLKDSASLPPITKRDIEPVKMIVQRHASASEIPRSEVEKFTATLKRWISDATPLSGDIADQSRESGVPNLSLELASALAKLRNEPLRDYVEDILNKGLRDPSSELSVAFTRTLENLPLERLLGIRLILESTQEIPESLRRAVEGRVQHEFLSKPATLDAVGLADLYSTCVRMGARQSEVAQVLNEFRARLRLPPNQTSATPTELSPAALLVWRWMFSDLPPDGELLADMTRVHFNKMTGHLARRVSFNTPRGSALDATLRYGEELGLLESYKPNRALLEAPLARLIIFTTLTRQHIGDKYGIVDTLIDSICSRLLKGEVQSRDLFSHHWKLSTNTKGIEELSADIAKRLARRTTSTSFEDLARLVANMRFLERKGPSHFGRLYQHVRPLFVEHIPRALPRQLQEQDPQALRRSVKAIAATRYRSLELLDALSSECVAHVESFSPDEFAELGSNFATLKSGTPKFWSTFASRVERDWRSFSDEMRMAAIISLILNAPEKVPQSFDVYTMVASGGDRSYEKVVQALIALGRYIPRAHDHTYRRLTTMQTPHEPHQHEVEFMRDLPAHIGVPANSIFSQVIVGGFETDFVVDFGHRRLIIELDGAAHFLTGPDGGMLQGRDEFQDIVFRRLGYEVIHVPFHSQEQLHEKGGFDYRMLQSLVDILKREALDPKTVPLVYLEPLKANNGGSVGEPPTENPQAP